MGSSGVSKALRRRYFSRLGCFPSGRESKSHIFSLGSTLITRSSTALSRYGTRASTPQAIVLLFARSTSHWCSRVVLRTVSRWNSSGLGYFTVAGAGKYSVDEQVLGGEINI